MTINHFSTITKPIIVLALTTIFFTSQSASAIGHDKSLNQTEQQGQHTSKRGHQVKSKLKRLAKHLDLTKTQKTALREIFVKEKSTRKAQRERMASFRGELRKLSVSSDFDETQFDLIYEEYQNDFKVAALEKAKIRHAMMQVLTPEQQNKMQKLAKKKRRPELF